MIHGACKHGAYMTPTWRQHGPLAGPRWPCTGHVHTAPCKHEAYMTLHVPVFCVAVHGCVLGVVYTNN